MTLLLGARLAFGQCAGDFDRDGYEDLAIGVPGETVSGQVRAGAVNVLYGSSSSLTASRSRYLHQDTTGIPGVAESGDGFGSSLACGDFNGDGFDDLAIGVPYEAIGDVGSGGAINVLFGSSGGLVVGGSQLLYLESIGFTTRSGDRFGTAIAAGDFDGDGYDDLAVGTPGRDTSAGDDAGLVFELFGSPGGLGAFPSQGGLGGLAANERLGSSLATGDFNGDGVADLAVGVPYAAVSGLTEAGMVRALRGHPGLGLVWSAGQFWHQDIARVEGIAASRDRFGYSLAAGDFDGDGFDDLAIGAPWEDVDGASNAGGLNVIMGSPDGLTEAFGQFLTQDATGGANETNDFFGFSLTASDANRDGRDELFVGVPGEDGRRGSVHVFQWSETALVRLQIAAARVQGGVQAGDLFGWALTTGDFDGNDRCELVVGNPRDDVAGMADAGSITVLAPRSVRYFTQETARIGGVAGRDDHFGQSLGQRGP
jgi:hypothetical protein